MVRLIRKLSFGVRGLLDDRRGVVAIEFAMIVPIMLVMFFGVVEFTAGVAVDRKVTLAARTLSDLTSQSTTVADTDLASFGQAAKAILTPYAGIPLKATVTEIYIDTTTKVAKVLWSRALTVDTAGNITAGVSTHHNGEIVTVPSAFVVGGTYLIWSEVSYNYVPAVGYVMAKAGLTLSDFSYTRPRQSACVIYPTPSSGTLPTCPTS